MAQMWPDFRCYPSCSPSGIHGTGPACNPECFQYKGTMDVFYKIVRQVQSSNQLHLILICMSLQFCFNLIQIMFFRKALACYGEALVLV
jgi:hypothetical protein